MRKVMITGMSGLIGGVLRNHLDSIGGYQLSALNRTPVEGVLFNIMDQIVMMHFVSIPIDRVSIYCSVFYHNDSQHTIWFCIP